MGSALYNANSPTPVMSEQKRKDQVVAVRYLIKRLLVYGRERKEEKENLAKEEKDWNKEASSSQMSKEEFFWKKLEAAIQMVECIYDLDGPEDLLESPELVKFLCAEPNKPPPEVQDPLETIDLGVEEDLRLI
ncbi:hypothetical protein PS2_030729 [Malus domestica]